MQLVETAFYLPKTHYKWHTRPISDCDRYCVKADSCRLELISNDWTPKCFCGPGYKKNKSNDTICEDVDECVDGLSKSVTGTGNEACDNDKASCVNLAGSYRCDCHDGFEFVDKSDSLKLRDGCQECCVNIDECERGTHTCGTHPCEDIDSPTKFRCICDDPFTASLDGRSCVHPCDSAGDPCQNTKTNHLTLARTCRQINQTAEFSCDCSSGYFWSYETLSCLDIDECSTPQFNNKTACNPTTSMCENLQNGYNCRCYQGYKPAAENVILASKASGCFNCCVDIDECLEESDACGDVCVYGTQDQGSPLAVNYTCGCRTARFLLPDLKTCVTCQYQPWGEFEECQGTCGIGEATKRRVVMPGFGYDHQSCWEEKLVARVEPCSTAIPCIVSQECAIDNWTPWSQCDKSCGDGTKARNRLILSGKGSCPADTVIHETKPCFMGECEPAPFPYTAVAMAGTVLVAALAAIVYVLNHRTPASKRQMGGHMNYYDNL